MSDEHMDARLRAAGEHWRAANEEPAGVDVAKAAAVEEHEITDVPHRRPRRVGLLASAAVIAAALVVGGTIALSDVGSRHGGDSAGTAGIQGRVWQLRGYGDQVRDGSGATFYIDSHGDLVADDTCDLYLAKAKVDGNSLTVTGGVDRYRSCTDSVGEVVFTNGGTKVLRGTSTYAIHGTSLTITRGGTSMHLAALPAGTPPPTSDIPTFRGAHWTLAKAVDKRGTPVQIDKDTPFFVADDGTLAASDGCNGLPGTVTGDGPRVRITGGAHTEIGCPSATLLESVLTGYVREQVIGASLTITKAGVGTLTYRWVPSDAAAHDPKQLYGVDWRLASVAGAAPAGHAPGSGADLYISASGQYSAFDGCEYSAGGKVTAGHGTISFTGVPSSDRSCTGRVGAQSGTILSFLRAGGLWSVRAGKLILDGGGAQGFSIVYSARGNQTPVAADQLTGTWLLDSIKSGNSGSAPDFVSYAATPKIIFDGNGGFSAKQDCPTRKGMVKIGDGTLSFDVAARSGSCKKADWLGPVISSDVAWRIDQSDLVLTKGDTTITFTRASGSSPTGLTSTSWTLSSVGHNTSDNGSSTGGSGFAKYELGFDDKGGFTVVLPCGPESGSAKVAGDTVSFTDITGAARGCARSTTSEIEVTKAFVAVLTKGTTWSIDGNRLTLTHGSVELDFDAA